jgi:GDP-fucose transporter C1
MVPVLWISGELADLRECELLHDPQTWINMTFTGIFGFLINIAIFLQIKYTSPLTNNISGTLKACVQTLFAMAIYRNPITTVVRYTVVQPLSHLERFGYFPCNLWIFLVLQREIQ